MIIHPTLIDVYQQSVYSCVGCMLYAVCCSIPDCDVGSERSVTMPTGTIARRLSTLVAVTGTHTADTTDTRVPRKAKDKYSVNYYLPP